MAAVGRRVRPGAYPVTTTLALVATAVVLAAVNLWVHVGPSRWQPVTGPLLAVLACCSSGRWAGLTWAAAGPGPRPLCPDSSGAGRRRRSSPPATPSALSVPACRRPLPRRPAPPWARPERLAAPSLLVPLGVVVFEEVAFRGVLWGLVERRATAPVGRRGHLGALRRSGTSSRRSTAPAPTRGGFWRGASAPAAGVLLAAGRGHRRLHDALAGVVFAVLRDQSGSLLAPFLLHWATNGLGILARRRALDHPRQ